MDFAGLKNRLAGGRTVRRALAFAVADPGPERSRTCAPSKAASSSATQSGRSIRQLISSGERPSRSALDRLAPASISIRATSVVPRAQLMISVAQNHNGLTRKFRCYVIASF